jgi:hypothetical protein
LPASIQSPCGTQLLNRPLSSLSFAVALIFY